MSRYGFRVYGLHHRYGRTRADHEWVDESWSAPAWFKASAALLKDKLTEATIPLGKVEELAQLPTVTETVPHTRYARLISAESTDRRLSLRLRYGMGSDFSYAMSPAGDQPLGKRAPSREYRAELLMPAQDGRALLAVESVSRACPGPSVIQWLNVASYLNRPDQAGPWHRLVGNQVSDVAYLDELIGKSDSANVTLRHRATDGIGNRARTTYVLQAPIKTKNQRGKAIDWAKEQKRGVSGMLDIFGLSSSGDLDFNDGYLMLDDGDATTRIGLSDARDTFTYSIGDDEPTLTKWQQTVKGRFAIIEASLAWS